MNELLKAARDFKELQEALELEREYSQFLETMFLDMDEEEEEMEAEEEEDEEVEAEELRQIYGGYLDRLKN